MDFLLENVNFLYDLLDTACLFCTEYLQYPVHSVSNLDVISMAINLKKIFGSQISSIDGRIMVSNTL